jgi:hypothetical protein
MQCRFVVMRGHMRVAYLFALLALIAAQALAAQALPEASRTPPCRAFGGIPALAMVEPSLLGGADFAVDPCADLVGHMAQFVLVATVPAGEEAPPSIRAESIDLLELRVAEMDAVRRLRALGAAGTAGSAAADSLKQTGGALVQVVTRPVESVVGLPAGALRFFGRRASDLGRQASNAGERTAEALADDVQFDRPGFRPGGTQALPPEPEPWWQKGGGFALKLGKRWLGYNSARRELGLSLGIDPYSTNPWLNAEMDRLAWSSLVGRRGVGLGLGQIGGAAGLTLSQGGRIHRMVWTKPPEEVREWNDARLAPLGCHAEAIDEFLDNARFSPTLQTQVVDSLLSLAPQEGCDLLLGEAATVEREAEARYVVDALQLLVAAHPHFPARFEKIGEALVMRDLDGRLWMALPVDLLQWTPGTAQFFDAPGFASVPDKRALLGRTASPKARAALIERGWAVFEESIGPARELSARVSNPSD